MKGDVWAGGTPLGEFGLRKLELFRDVGDVGTDLPPWPIGSVVAAVTTPAAGAANASADVLVNRRLVMPDI
jgi:hypothetical protein